MRGSVSKNLLPGTPKVGEKQCKENKNKKKYGLTMASYTCEHHHSKQPGPKLQLFKYMLLFFVTKLVCWRFMKETKDFYLLCKPIFPFPSCKGLASCHPYRPRGQQIVFPGPHSGVWTFTEWSNVSLSASHPILIGQDKSHDTTIIQRWALIGWDQKLPTSFWWSRNKVVSL